MRAKLLRIPANMTAHEIRVLRAQEFDKQSFDMREGMDCLSNLFSNGCAAGTGAFLPGAWPHT